MPNLNSDEFAIGFAEELGLAWWADNSMLGINQFPAGVPLDVAYRMLDWQPIRVPMAYKYADHSQPMVQLIRPGDMRYLVGIQTAEYTDTTYRDRLLDNVEKLIDDSIGTKIGAVGLLSGGRQAFLQITMDDIVTHEPTGEKFKMWLCAYSSLDGSYANTYQTGTLRIQCRNTFQSFRERKKDGNSYRYRNTRYGRLDIPTARDVLKLFGDMQTELWAELDRAVGAQVTDSQWEQILEKVFPTEGKSGKALSRAENLQHAVDSMYRHDIRVGFRGTEWGALQAFTTHMQHEVNVRQGYSKASRNVTWLLDRKLSDQESEWQQAIASVLRPKELAKAK